MTILAVELVAKRQREYDRMLTRGQDASARIAMRWMERIVRRVFTELPPGLVCYIARSDTDYDDFLMNRARYRVEIRESDGHA